MIASVTDGCDNGQTCAHDGAGDARCYRNYRSIRKTDARCLSASFTMNSLPNPRERVLKDAARTNTGGSALIHMHVSQLNELPLTAEVWNE